MSAAPISELLEPLFGSLEACALFNDRARIKGMLDFEAALARAEARTGVIPASAAPTIAKQCRPELFDMTELARGTARAGKDRKSTRLNSSHIQKSRMPSSA